MAVAWGRDQSRAIDGESGRNSGAAMEVDDFSSPVATTEEIDDDDSGLQLRSATTMGRERGGAARVAIGREGRRPLQWGKCQRGREKGKRRGGKKLQVNSGSLVYSA